MPTQLRLSPHQLADLAEIRDTDPSRLQSLIEHLRKLPSPPMVPDALHQEIKVALGASPENAGRVLRTLLSLRAIIRQRKLTPDDVIEGVRFAIDSSDPKWVDAEMGRWGGVEPLLKDLLSLQVVRLVATALDLSYEYENLLQGARVVTDIRPVFSEDLAKIEGAVVSHTLRIRYDSAEGDHSISLAMDEKDIRALEEQCQRALQKAQTARSLMSDQAKVPTVVTGENTNG